MTRFLRQRQVCEVVGLSPMTLWRHEKAGTFPRRVRLGPNSVAWVAEEIETWCAERAAERDQLRPELRDAPGNALLSSVR